MLRKELKINLEFLADQSVLSSGFDAEQYQMHLLRITYPKTAVFLTNNFNVLPLKKRIKMMNKRKTPQKGLLKYMICIPLLAVIFFVNCAQSPGKTEATSETTTETETKTTSQDPAIGTEVAEPTITTTTSDPDDSVFTHVEQMPEFPGGTEKLMEFLGTNIKYPDDAFKEGVQGLVVVKFIVDKKGNVKDGVVVRGLSASTDKEALRVVGIMPQWTPGKQDGKDVDVFFTLPIKFRLTH
jgi:TonB family protein